MCAEDLWCESNAIDDSNIENSENGAGRQSLFIVGLQKRPDLNGEVVVLLDWKEANGRWSARCCHSREGVCIKPINLKATRPLDPVMSDCLKGIVRGGPDMPFLDGVGTGQISRRAFAAFTSLALEIYRDAPPEAELAAIFIEHIGKFGDCRLVFKHLKQKIASSTPHLSHFGIQLPDPLRSMFEMNTVDSLMTLMVKLRRGTIAHLRSQQSLLRSFMKNQESIKIGTGDPSRAVVMRMHGRDGNKSMTLQSIADELIHAGMYGEATILGQDGVEKVKFDEILHRAYVGWLVDDVLPTLDQLDAKTGSLGEWHRVLAWESQLTASVIVTPRALMLDVSDDYSIDSWLGGLVSLDISKLEDIPGVDTDRRILRLILYTEKAFKAVVEGMDERPHQENESPDNGDVSTTDVTQHQPEEIPASRAIEAAAYFREGTKVVVVDIDEKGQEGVSVCNGMQGRVHSVLEDGKYLVSFSNLECQQVVLGANLKRVENVEHEDHLCLVCSRDAQFLCSRCNLSWYCSASCQRGDYKKHRAYCKYMAPQNPFLDSMLKESEQPIFPDDSEEESVSEAEEEGTSEE